MKVNNKLIYGLTVILGIFVVSSAITVYNLKDIKNLSEKTAKESVPMAIVAADTKFQTCQIQQFLTDSSLTQDLEVINEAKDAYDKFLLNMNEFEKMYKNENDVKNLEKIKHLKEKASKLFETGKKMVSSYAISKEEGDALMEEVDKASIELAALVDELKDSQINEALHSSKITFDTSTYSL